MFCCVGFGLDRLVSSCCFAVDFLGLIVLVVWHNITSRLRGWFGDCL